MNDAPPPSPVLEIDDLTEEVRETYLTDMIARSDEAIIDAITEDAGALEGIRQLSLFKGDVDCREIIAAAHKITHGVWAYLSWREEDHIDAIVDAELEKRRESDRRLS